ncbi:MAG: carbohydrate binding domain-containing protein [Candidatus Thiodiazotropha sp.]|nr:carbohydrate binding domain-containing protein [Candidatus Thiodiazotropha sp.]MCM8881725.1 carbohydrate binding domain-containing protein [Candidatus Thiodiazotropha sp.]MCM8920804.1 carbohydrate binding domain-containing protein [Candidatus Thiodiazotropha sp.]
MKKRLAYISVVLLTGLSFNLSANLMLNGSFEDNIVGNWDVFSGIDGWDTSSGSGIEIQTNSTLGFIDAQDGNNYVELDSHNNSTMFQKIDGLIAGLTYDISFWYSARTNNGDNDNGINMLWGQDALSLDEIVSIDDATRTGSWMQNIFSLTATDATMYLAFEADGLNNSYGGLIDNIELVASVPEPSVIALLGAGLFGLGFARRRAKR